MVFVAANKQETMQEFAKKRKSTVQVSDLGGYPAAQVSRNNTDCLLSVDVSDQGALFINTGVPHDATNPCELSKQFAQAAVQNLPNA